MGVLLGLCVLTRHVGICLLVAVIIDRLWFVSPETPHLDPPSRGAKEPGGGERRDWRGAAIIGLGAVVLIGPWIGWLATVRSNTQVGLIDATGILPRLASQSLFYARRMPDALTGPFVEVATIFTRSRAVGIVATLGASVISTILVVGLIRASMDPRRRLAGLVPLVTLPLLLVWPFTEAGRFLIPLVPCLLVGMAEGLAWCLGLFLRTVRYLRLTGAGVRIGIPGRIFIPSPLEGGGQGGG